LSQAEYDELIALVDFTQKQAIEPLKAKRALNHLQNQTTP
jgi:hypothetical protein